MLNTQCLIADEIYGSGSHLIDNFLAPEHYNALCTTIRSRHKEGEFKQAKIGHERHKTHNATIRNDQILWLDTDDSDEGIQAYFRALDLLRETLNQSLFLGLVDYEAHFSVYPPNSFYKKHIDQFSTTQDRRISCVYYLNDDWKPAFGGELKLYGKNTQRLTTVLPLGNRFICFNSDMPHEVCMAFQKRYSIAAWLKIRPIGRI